MQNSFLMLFLFRRISDPGLFAIHDDLKALLDQWYREFTEGGIKEMNGLAAGLTDDAVTRKLAEEFAAGEEEHCGWAAKHLALIEKLGYDNCLPAMMNI